MVRIWWHCFCCVLWFTYCHSELHNKSRCQLSTNSLVREYTHKINPFFTYASNKKLLSKVYLWCTIVIMIHCIREFNGKISRNRKLFVNKTKICQFNRDIKKNFPVDVYASWPANSCLLCELLIQTEWSGRFQTELHWRLLFRHYFRKKNSVMKTDI